MEFGEILTWLILFIIGSLIVSFIINPSNFDSFKGRIDNFFDSISSNEDNLVIVSSYGAPCMDGQDNRVMCYGACSVNGLVYKKYKCENGGLVCYCEKGEEN